MQTVIYTSNGLLVLGFCFYAVLKAPPDTLFFVCQEKLSFAEEKL